MLGNLTLSGVTIQQYFGAEPRPDQASRNRRAMLEKVWAIWITGFLQPSLPHDILLDLGLTERPAMVTRTLDLYAQRPDLVDQMQAPGTRLLDVFDRLDRALLILGSPGAGKTTLLLTLARDLLIRAAQDPEQSIPVVFPLSSWAAQRRPLADWLIEALHEQYQVPRKTGRTWVEADQILPLLDGLDEVAAVHRAACVEAINTFRQEHGLLPLVASSRVADYEALEARLRLQGALVVQPLTPAQVDSYLTQIGEPLAALREAIRDEPMLWELLDTPLMLTIVTLACTGELVETLRLRGTPDEWRQHLFAAYVDRMFRRRSAITDYTRPQTERWLAWLAWQMSQHSQTVFYLEGIQPDWLPSWQRWWPTSGVRWLDALVGGLVNGLVFGVIFGMVREGVASKGGRLVGGFVVGLVFGVAVVRSAFGRSLRQQNSSRGWVENLMGVQALYWSWITVRPRLSKITVFGLVLGLVGGLGHGLLYGLVVGLFSWLIGVLISGWSRYEIPVRTIPNEGFRRAALNALSKPRHNIVDSGAE